MWLDIPQLADAIMHKSKNLTEASGAADYEGIRARNRELHQRPDAQLE